MQEYIFLHLSHYSSKNFYCHVDIENFYLDIKDISEHHGDKTVLLFHIFENLELSQINAFGLEAFRNILDHFKVKYYFVLDGLYQGQHQLINSHNIITLNWGMLYVYYNTMIKNHERIEAYNPVTGKGLFFCGKGNKPHRIGLLKKFYETDTLHNLTWSYINTDVEKQQIKNEFFSEYTDEDYIHFTQQCERVLDYTPEYDENSWTFSHFGYPCDLNLYKNTGFSIISETWVNFGTHLMTEKTWRVISNKHPFIMVGSPYNVIKLKQLGFKTFNEYLTIPDYDTIDHLDDRLDAVVTNASNLRTLLEKKEPELMEQLKIDTEYNCARFNQLARDDINNFLSALQADESLLESIVEFHHHQLKFIRNQNG
jgi:hypothetical protein